MKTEKKVMKYIIILICLLVLSGCADSQSKTAAQPKAASVPYHAVSTAPAQESVTEIGGKRETGRKAVVTPSLDVSGYAAPEDFYEYYYDDFTDFEDAEEYYYEHGGWERMPGIKTPRTFFFYNI